MRPDMQHLLVERGHAGTGYTRFQPKGWKARCRPRYGDEDELETWREPIRSPHFSENLRPLYRYLDAQVGRPWDKVYAEVRAHVNADSAVQYHILQHLYDRLAVHVWPDAEGDLWYRERWGQIEPLMGRWGPDLYVCPDTGLIRRVKRRRQQPRPAAPVDRMPGTGPDHEYRNLDGQWYEVWWGTMLVCDKPHRHIARKRQLGYKELRKLGLRT